MVDSLLASVVGDGGLELMITVHYECSWHVYRTQHVADGVRFILLYIEMFIKVAGIS